MRADLELPVPDCIADCVSECMLIASLLR
jgi:hypothetical protein